MRAKEDLSVRIMFSHICKIKPNQALSDPKINVRDNEVKDIKHFAQTNK